MYSKFVKVYMLVITVLGVLCVLLYLIWGIAYSFMPANLNFWLIGGGVLLSPAIIGAVIKKLKPSFTLPKALSITLISLLTLCFAVFFTVEGFVISNLPSDYSGDAEYIVVLGARVNGTVPSKSLKLRIDAAYGYLASHPDCKAILSGGQGEGEDISEAECMRRELESRGISGERLFIEDKSTSTAENLRYSDERYSLKGKNVVIVTSNFHIFRAKLIAKTIGIEAHAIGAPADIFILPHYMMREFFTTVVDTLRSNIDPALLF